MGCHNLRCVSFYKGAAEGANVAQSQWQTTESRATQLELNLSGFPNLMAHFKHMQE